MSQASASSSVKAVAATVNVCGLLLLPLVCLPPFEVTAVGRGVAHAHVAYRYPNALAAIFCCA